MYHPLILYISLWNSSSVKSILDRSIRKSSSIRRSNSARIRCWLGYPKMTKPSFEYPLCVLCSCPHSWQTTPIPYSVLTAPQIRTSHRAWVCLWRLGCLIILPWSPDVRPWEEKICGSSVLPPLFVLDSSSIGKMRQGDSFGSPSPWTYELAGTQQSVPPIIFTLRC